MRLRILTIAGTGAAALLVSGCAAGLEETAEDSSAATTSTGSGNESSGAPTGGASSGAPSGSGEVLRIELPADLEQDCGGRDVEIVGTGDDNDDRDIELNGQCGAVTIEANNGEIELDAAASVSVSGSFNRVEANVVDSVTVSGSDNDVEYDRASAGPEPTIEDTGSGNRIVLDDDPSDDNSTDDNSTDDGNDD